MRLSLSLNWIQTRIPRMRTKSCLLKEGIEKVRREEQDEEEEEDKCEGRWNIFKSKLRCIRHNASFTRIKNEDARESVVAWITTNINDRNKNRPSRYPSSMPRHYRSLFLVRPHVYPKSKINNHSLSLVYSLISQIPCVVLTFGVVFVYPWREKCNTTNVAKDLCEDRSFLKRKHKFEKRWHCCYCFFALLGLSKKHNNTRISICNM